ncbi:MAG: hypothetical protein JXB62_18660 [Pirellulales bacterium]|nr:hypothetical protein [Pirellulales bacterium]
MFEQPSAADPPNVTDPPAAPIRPRMRRLRRWMIVILAGFVALLGVVAVFWFSNSPKLPSGPVRLVRGHDGRLVPASGAEDQRGAWLEVQAGKLAAQDTFSSSSGEIRSGPARFACRRLAIFNRSNRLLLQRAGAELPEQFAQLGFIEQVDYHPHGVQCEEGLAAPDVVIVLDLVKLEESVTLLSRKLEVEISVTAGNSIASSRAGYTDHLTPPVLCFHWEGTLRHRSTTTGLESSAAKYKLAAADVAKQIGDALVKQFRQWHEKDGPLPELPEVFYPPYEQPPPLPFLDAYEAKRLTACHGLMNHNETFWQLATDAATADVLTGVQRQMESAGWRTSDISTEQTKLPHLRMTCEGAVLEVFPPRRRDARPPQTFTGGQPGAPPEATTFYVRYLDRMTQAELTDAIERTFSDDVSSDVLLLFEQSWSQDQRQRVLEILKTRRPTTCEAWLALAGLHHDLKQVAEARDALVRAQTLLRTVGNQGDLPNRIRQLAKKLGDEKLAEVEPDPAIFAELGFVELKPGVEVPPIELALNEPAHFFWRADAKLATLSVSAVREASPGGAAQYQLVHVKSFRGGRSWGQGTHIAQEEPERLAPPPNLSVSLDGLGHAEITVVKLPGKKRFRLSTTLILPEDEAEEDEAKEEGS